MKKGLFTVVFLAILTGVFAQDTAIISGNGMEGFEFDDGFRGNASIRIMFYNTENFFDIYNDSLTDDDTFTPEGENHWNRYKYEEKLDHLSKTIFAIGGWESVEIIGLCEVEHRSVLEDLTQKTILKDTPYEIIHQESRDNRGIDVGLLYRKDKMTLDTVQFIEVFLGEGERPTRDVLCATFTTPNDSKVHVFVNHWPSRYGGQLQSDPKRKAAAKAVKTVTDSILHQDSLANILLMGDFNDYPDNESIHDVLGAQSDTNYTSATFFNLMSTIPSTRGSHKYQGNWGTLDQIMISKALFKGYNNLKVLDGPLIFAAPYLLMEETKYPGVKPFRTYLGLKYIGGYSDHLPVFVDLQLLH